MTRLVFTALLILAVVACNTPPDNTGDGGLPDTGTLADGVVSADGAGDSGVTLNLPQGSDGHKDVGQALTSGKIRAGKVTTKSQLLSGVKVEGRVGDYKIYNDKVAFIIQAGRVSDGWNPFGGEVVDAMRVDQPGSQGHSLLGETLLGVGIHILKPTSVGVINDGSDGKAALIRVIGEPALVPYLAGMLGPTFGGDLDVHMVMDYLLKPNSEVLEIRLRLFNKIAKDRELPFLIVGLSGGDGAEFFSSGVGFVAKTMAKMNAVSMLGRHIGYTLVTVDKPLTSLVPYSGVWVLSGEILKAPASGEVSKTYHLGVTAGEPEAAQKLVRQLLKKSEPPAFSGTVKDKQGLAVADARVHVETLDSKGAVSGYASMTRTDAKGAYKLALAAGDHRFTVVADGRAPSAGTKVTVGSSGGTQDLTVGGSGSIAFSVTEGSTNVPSKIVFTPAGKVTSPPKSFGEKTHPHGAALLVYSATGKGSVKLPPETYTVHASRGFEYEVDTAKVTLADSKSESVALKLKRSVDTTGYMCGDFHLHSLTSPDSSDLYEFKVTTLAAAGVEIPVSTDHEFISDYNPFIAKLGLQKWIYGIVGEELTTLTYGHFNVLNIKQDSTKPNMGAMVWYQKTPAKLFGDVDKQWPSSVLQVNHPRSAAIGGYFTYVGYNAKTGKADKIPSEWSRNFDAFEVFNSKRFKTTLPQEVSDWFSFLDRGFLVTGVGNSDSHKAYYSQVGWPRNYVKLSTDQPNKLNLAEFSAAVKAQKVLMSGGPFINVSIGSKGMGQVVDATSKKATIKIKVQAPTWMAADRLLVYMGGKVVHDKKLDSTTADPKNAVVRYEGSLELLPAADTWVVVVVTGGGSLAPVSNGSPFAVTNPIYLDLDGNKAYDAPKAF